VAKRRDILSARILRIGGVTWRVKYVDSKPLAKDEMGECDITGPVLYVRKGMGRAATVRTLAHEMVHALGFDDEAAPGFAEAFAGVLLENGLI